MNIQEAIKSGKPFRRKGWPDDDVFAVVENPEEDFIAVMETDRFAGLEFSIQDILANDWYTRDDFRVVWHPGGGLTQLPPDEKPVSD
jgi:hypothetical protein